MTTDNRQQQDTGKSAIRTLIIIALSGIAMVTLLSEPTAQSDSAWIMQFIASKSAGLVSGLCAVGLYKYWSKTDKWIKSAEASSHKAMLTPNPTHISRKEEKI